MIVIVVSDDCIVVKILGGWVVVVSLCSSDCWGGGKILFSRNCKVIVVYLATHLIY